MPEFEFNNLLSVPQLETLCYLNSQSAIENQVGCQPIHHSLDNKSRLNEDFKKKKNLGKFFGSFEKQFHEAKKNAEYN